MSEFKKVKDSGDDNKLPAIPELTEEMQVLIDEQQSKLAHSHPLNASNREYENAHALITQLETQGALLGRHQREQYAEALAITGQYEKAAAVTQDPDKKKEWKTAWKAVWREDSDSCDCEDTETVVMEKGKPKKIKLSPKFVVKRIFSHKHNDFVNLEACNKCHFKNAR